MKVNKLFWLFCLSMVVLVGCNWLGDQVADTLRNEEIDQLDEKFRQTMQAENYTEALETAQLLARKTAAVHGRSSFEHRASLDVVATLLLDKVNKPLQAREVLTRLISIEKKLSADDQYFLESALERLKQIEDQEYSECLVVVFA